MSIAFPPKKYREWVYEDEDDYSGSGGTVSPPSAPPPATSSTTTPTSSKIIGYTGGVAQIIQHYYPQSAPPAVTNLDIVNEVADAMQVPPASVNKAYADRVVDAARFLKVSPNIRAPEVSTQAPPVADNYASLTVVRVEWIDNEYERNRALQASAAVLAFIARVEDFIVRASNVGRLPPDNPFAVIAELNKRRGFGRFTPISIDEQLASDLVFSMKAYVQLLEAENQGGIDFKNEQVYTSQLAHVKLSYDGLGGSGNPVTDIMQFLPDGEALKRQNARDAMSVVDFSKRVPRLLFTMEYAPKVGLPAQGVLVGWRKIPDASGYIIRRRDVFGGRNVAWRVSNAQAALNTELYLAYAKLFGISFMEGIDDKSTIVVLDKNVVENEYYLYKIQAYQERIAKVGGVTVVPYSVSSFSQLSLQVLTEGIVQSSGAGEDLLNPWPFWSQYLYQNSSHDWVLAAVNIRASIQRGDDRTTTRKYSYLNANNSFLREQALAGKFVRPNDLSSVQRAVEDSIQKFGVNQTIQTLLDETGITYYYDGREIGEDTHFDRAGAESAHTSKLFRVVGSAIDPVTAILDVRTLASNMGTLLSGLVSSNSQLYGGEQAVSPGPSEIADPSKNEVDEKFAEGPLQFVWNFKNVKDPYIDLTTFEGISTLMRIIRLMSDLGPGRRLPSVRTEVPIAPEANAVIAGDKLVEITAPSAVYEQPSPPVAQPGPVQSPDPEESTETVVQPGEGAWVGSSWWNRMIGADEFGRTGFGRRNLLLDMLDQPSPYLRRRTGRSTYPSRTEYYEDE